MSCLKVIKAFIFLNLIYVCCVGAETGAVRRAEIECKNILETSSPSASAQILQGVEALVGEFPHMVALGYERAKGLEFLCGGSIISKNYVLTAAHCIQSFDGFKPTVVRTGVVDVGKLEWNNETDVGVAEYIKHPLYMLRMKYHDLLLLRLSKPLEFSPSVKPVCLETNDEDPTQPMVLTAWTQKNVSAAKSNILLKINVTAVSLSKCSETYNASTYKNHLMQGLTEDMMCGWESTDSYEESWGVMTGLLQVLGSNGHPRLVGIASFGKKGTPAPFVYTRISRYLDWIESVVWPN